MRKCVAKLVCCVAVAGYAQVESRGAERVQFSRDIRPILADVCYQCHGPDKKNREADLRLDVRESVFAERDGHRAVVPGDTGNSELLRRITSSDTDDRMPPRDAQRKLTPPQIELIRRWIDEGAEWQEHWAFVAPQRPPLPEVSDPTWCRNGIDRFVLARLEREGLPPSPEAGKETLIRRATLDLTGLPPTLEEVDAFLADDSPQAYERVVDRLLKSSHYGERMAWVWLDAARYADTSGYQNDGPRSMWRWRDWVIDAFNADMPFDQFTVEQIAGDMLPGATLDQKIATAFNRNHRGNAEGGIIAEEYQVEYVIDRVDTTATVWLGLTMGCGRCHDHKYDPITQKEFYQVFAYFNNIPEYGRAIKEGNSPPYIQAPTAEQRQQLAELDARITAAEQKFRSLAPRLDSEIATWEKAFDVAEPLDWQPSRALAARFRLDGDVVESRESRIEGRGPDSQNGSEGGDAETAAKVPRFAAGDAVYVPGRLGEAAEFDGQRFIDAGDVGRFGYFDKFSFGAWVNLADTRGGTVLSRMTDEAQGDGWYLQIVDGHVHVNLVKRWLDDSIRVQTQRTLSPGQWHHVLATYDGSRVAKGITIYVDGKPQTTVADYDFLNQTFDNDAQLRIGGGGGPDGRFHGLIDDARIYDDALSAADAAELAVADSISDIVGTPRDHRTAPQAAKLRQYFLEHHASQPIRAAHDKLFSLRRDKQALVESLPTVMVMQEMDQPRETFVLTRGQYNRPSEKVTPGVPAVFPPLPAGAPNNRLGFARWLVDRSNPLTARVTVNRFWQMLFGTGLVKTVEDFGTQGERPSHPQLLDWLAVESMDDGWSMKQLMKTIVMSAAYRQSSRVTPLLLERDRDNRLLARGPRFRLSAAMVRDQALAVSGLLTDKIGGPSVLPYQPAGLWKEIATDTEYKQSHGPDLYRRSLYTYWKRTVAPPNMVALDASSREACTVRQTRTNTPLQALALMNDVAFVEAARVFAQRIMKEGGEQPEDRIRLAFRLATARQPTSAEMQILLASLEHYLAEYDSDRDAAAKLVSAGEFPRDERFSPVELAAYTAICSLVLNLDETMTKE